MEIREAIASAKLRQSNRTDKRIELTMQLLLLNATFVRRTTNLEVIANVNWLVITYLAYGKHQLRHVLTQR